MTETANVVVIGAGIMGLNAALQIARRSPLRVLVLEKGRSLGEGSTGASSAVCRSLYSRDETATLSRDGIHAYRNWSDYVGLADPVARFHRLGVLWLASGRDGWAAAQAARLGRLGVAAETLDDEALRTRFPAINPCTLPVDLVTGAPHDCRGGGTHLLETEGGYFEPVDALTDLARTLRGRGVELRFGSHVTAIRTSGGRTVGVTLADGARIDAEAVIEAAGPWCNDLLATAGLEPAPKLRPTRVQIVHLDRPAAIAGNLPVCVDPPGGIYFRTENRGQQIVLGSVREEDEQEEVADPDDYDRCADDDFSRATLHALQHRLPGLTVGNVRGHSGLYTVNPADVHPLVGATPIEGLFVANGCSGHGFKLAPAIGSLLAQAVTGRGGGAFDTEVDPAFLAFERPAIALDAKSVLA